MNGADLTFIDSRTVADGVDIADQAKPRAARTLQDRLLAQHGQPLVRLTIINPFLPEPPPAAPRKRRRA